MSPAALILFVSLFFAQAAMAVPVPPHGVPTTVEPSVAPVSTATSTDVPPAPVFTLGPGGLPHASASSATTTQTRSFRPPDMDWLS